MESQDDKIDSQNFAAINTQEEQGLSWKNKNYIKVKNLSKYDVYLSVFHVESTRSYEKETHCGLEASGGGLSASLGHHSKVASRNKSLSPPILESDPGALVARKGKVCKKRRIYTSVKGDARTAISAFVKFDKELDYRDVEEEDRGRLYLFKDFFCGPQYIRNIKTEHVNALRREFRQGNLNRGAKNCPSTRKSCKIDESSRILDSIDAEGIRRRYFARRKDLIPDPSEYKCPDSPCLSLDSGVDDDDFDDFRDDSCHDDYDTDHCCSCEERNQTKRRKINKSI